MPLANGGNVDGASALTLTISNVVLFDAGEYDVVLSNRVNSVTSQAAVLTVNPHAPVITQQPRNLTNHSGETACFTVLAAGTAPLGYAWHRNGAPLTDDGRVVGSGTVALEIHQAQAADAADYFVVVSNALGSATSHLATVVVDPIPFITAHPHDLEVIEGEPVILQLTPAGLAPLYYQWFRNGPPSGGSSCP